MQNSDPPRKLRPLCDKIGRPRVTLTVEAFYARLHEDPLLAPYFAHLPDRAAHEQRIVEFWWIAMGGRSTAPPTVDMLGAHAPLGISSAALERWLALFEVTLHEQLPTDLATQWLTMARGIAARLRVVVRD